MLLHAGSCKYIQHHALYGQTVRLHAGPRASVKQRDLKQQRMRLALHLCGMFWRSDEGHRLAGGVAFYQIMLRSLAVLVRACLIAPSRMKAAMHKQQSRSSAVLQCGGTYQRDIRMCTKAWKPFCDVFWLESMSAEQTYLRRRMTKLQLISVWKPELLFFFQDLSSLPAFCKLQDDALLIDLSSTVVLLCGKELTELLAEQLQPCISLSWYVDSWYSKLYKICLFSCP